MGRMNMKKAFISILFSIAFSAALAQGVSAQEKSVGVCLVYFTSNSCGDDCRLTDTFMGGLLNEYTGNLPGQPQINVIGADNAKTGGKDGGGTGVLPEENGNGENGSGAAGQNPLTDIFTFEEPTKESLLSLVIIIAVLVVVGLVVFYIWGKSQESL